MADPVSIVVTEYAKYNEVRPDITLAGAMERREKVRQVTENRWLSYADAVALAATVTNATTTACLAPMGGGWWNCIVTADYAVTGVWIRTWERDGTDGAPA